MLHIDADAFFATVEQVLNPNLRGKALLVGGPSRKNGIVSAASYEARKFGVKSGMPMYLATRKCPNAVVVPGNFRAYGEFSKRMYQIFLEFTPEVEMASIDEAYIDISGCELMHGKSAEQIARTMLMKIYEKIGISVSCGLASNKTVAKVASSLNKPHKLTIVPFGKEKQFLSPLPLNALPGVGPKTFEVLERCGLQKISDLNRLGAYEVINKFGIGMIPVWKKACGIDNSVVISTPSLPKSISKEKTFYQSCESQKELLRILKELSVIVLTKLRAYELRAKTINLKIRYRAEPDEENRGRIFQDFSFQKHLIRPSNLDDEIFPQMKKLFLENIDAQNSVRLIGIGVSNLAQNYNLSLFENNRHSEKLFFSVDAIRKIHGNQAIKYGV